MGKSVGSYMKVHIIPHFSTGVSVVNYLINYCKLMIYNFVSGLAYGLSYSISEVMMNWLVN